MKAIQALLPDHVAQILNYMRIARQPVGYLINFAPIAGIEWKRLVLSKLMDRDASGSGAARTADER
ncbi:GxxExxY protein [Planctomycetota bacterium]